MMTATMAETKTNLNY